MLAKLDDLTKAYKALEIIKKYFNVSYRGDFLCFEFKKTKYMSRIIDDEDGKILREVLPWK